MDLLVGTVFVLVYTGMFLGELPRLRLDRAGIALAGAIVLVATGRMTTTAAWSAIDVPTIALLAAVTTISALLQIAGFFTVISRRIVHATRSPSTLLALVIIASGLLSAIFANSVVCVAMVPLLIDVCTRAKVDPIPHLLALACASNVGSAATLIGNPQTILIGRALQLSFVGYLVEASPPTIIGLFVIWVVIRWTYRGQWRRAQTWGAPPTRGLDVPAANLSRPTWRTLLALIDWRLLVLFVGLFVVNRAVAQAGLVSYYLMLSRMAGFDVTSPPLLFTGTAVLSNIVSPVPAVMLLLPAARAEIAGPVLALASTFAGNLFISGSVANIIVVDQAKRHGQVVKSKAHARVGIPVTLTTLAAAALWLWLKSA